MAPKGLPNPTRSAVATSTSDTTSTASNTAKPLPTSTTSSTLLYARRYLDWNRLTFAYHANGSQDRTFDIQEGKAVSAAITGLRQQLNLSSLYGCAPQTWCMRCKPFGDSGNIYTLLTDALSTIVISTTRSNAPRLIIINTDNIRFDIIQGPFTFDDNFIVSPRKNTFQFLPNVPYEQASVSSLPHKQ